MAIGLAVQHSRNRDYLWMLNAQEKPSNFDSDNQTLQICRISKIVFYLLHRDRTSVCHDTLGANERAQVFIKQEKIHNARDSIEDEVDEVNLDYRGVRGSV